MRKVSWPSRKQVESTTAVVIISVFAFAGYFEVIDTILSKGVHGILNYFTK
jgi:preprotein translocase subunit SecE